MVVDPGERQIVIRARDHLQQWRNDARVEAYQELFEGEDSILTAEEVQRLDALDSALEREGGDGVWGTDEYGIHTGRNTGSATELGVVCVYHPRITEDSVLQGTDDRTDEFEERLNVALWEYSERVATLIEDRLDEFLRQSQQEGVR